jgi:Rad3-related DNA helicase
MPYNYLVDSRIRDNYKIDFANSIIIIDEAHNIEWVAEDVASFDLNLNTFYNIFGEIDGLVKYLENQPKDGTGSV